MEPGASNTDSLVTVLIQELDNCNGLLEVGRTRPASCIGDSPCNVKVASLQQFFLGVLSLIFRDMLLGLR